MLNARIQNDSNNNVKSRGWVKETFVGDRYVYDVNCKDSFTDCIH